MSIKNYPLIERFFKELTAAPPDKRALLLDYDGTLAPFNSERDQAFPYPGVREILTSLIEKNTSRVVIISGRAIRDVVALLDLRVKALPEIWGSHGRERRLPNGQYERSEVRGIQRSGLDRIREWAEKNEMGKRFEAKPYSAAFHWRGLSSDNARQLKTTVRDFCRPLATENGLELHEFDGGLEIRVPGRDKGFAVRSILKEMQSEDEKSNPAAAYLGDDYTDEDAFNALKGRGLCVLVRGEERPTAADVWIRPPEDLLDFLARWAEACA